MPRLTQHATDGVQFTRAYANGYSTPISFPTILTGTYPDHYGGHGYISDNRPALAAKFQTAGYKTAGFHTNPHLRRKKNYDRGFGTYGDFNDEAGQFSWIRYLITQNLDNDSLSYKLLKRIYHFLRTTSETSDYAKAPKLNQKALNWLDQNYGGESPFFLWIHYMDVHYPFYPPDKYLIDNSISSKRAISLNGKMHEENTELSDADINDLKALYRGEVRYTDHYIGELLEDMKKRDLFDETIFIITSDHGELFGEHELSGHPPSGYEESFHVPFVMFGPGIAEDRQVDQMSSLLDLPPTVADLSDLDIDPDWEGESLLKYIQNNREASKKGMYLGDTDVLSYQTNEWRLTWWRTRDNPEHPEQEWELWKLPECERIPLAEQKTVVERFREKLREYVDRTNNQKELSKPAIDRMTEERLEALGYK
jgi:arylsulfatase A-like enzyme